MFRRAQCEVYNVQNNVQNNVQSSTVWISVLYIIMYSIAQYEVNNVQDNVQSAEWHSMEEIMLRSVAYKMYKKMYKY